MHRLIITLCIGIAYGKIIVLPKETIWHDPLGKWTDDNYQDMQFSACIQGSNWNFDSVSDLNPPVAATPQRTQYDSLMSFYTAASGPSWRNNDNWGIGDPCFQNWYGIECDCSGSVTKIHLADNRLSGYVHTDINRITSLRELDLHTTTRYVHSIPDVNRNDLGGNMPTLSSLSNLQLLDVSLNSITALPGDIHSNSALEVLSASGNKLTSFPLNLGSLTNLRILELADNIIEDAFPVSAVCQLHNIYVLDFGNNSISGTFYDSCMEALNPMVFDVSAPNPGHLGSSNSLQGDIPSSLTTSWSNVKDGYISFYLLFGITGHFASPCIDIRFCRWFNCGSQNDMAWIADGLTVPQSVFDTIAKALEY